MPLDDEMIADLLRWRSETPYAKDGDWIFASIRMKGRQPLWPEAIMRNYIRPAAQRLAMEILRRPFLMGNFAPAG